MSESIELAGLTFGLICFYTILLVPLGALISRRLLPDLPLHFCLLTSIGFSAIVYTALMLLLVHYGASNLVIAWVLRLTAAAALFEWLRSSGYKVLAQTEVRGGLVLMALYVMLCMHVSAFPVGDAQDVMVDTTMHFTGLPVDNIIPYNFSRYIVERVNPMSVDVVPGWAATDRGPLGGILNAVVFITLGLEESSHWSSSTPGLFFVYQSLLTFLNALSLLAVWVVANHFAGKRAAVYSVLALGSSYFYFMNVLFSWPKFLLGFFVLVALVLWHYGKRWPYVGLFFGLAMLSHDSAIFTFAAFGCVIVVRFLLDKDKSFFERLRVSVRPLAAVLGSFLATIAPWVLYKKLFAEESPRLLYMHLFCNRDADADLLTFTEAYARYRETHSWGDIASIKLQNLSYPFNAWPSLEALGSHWRNPFFGIMSIADYAFFQVVIGVGLMVFLLALYALYASRKTEAGALLQSFMLVSLGSVVFISLLSGCAGNAVNHIWAYPAFLVIALAVGWVVENSGLWSKIALSVGVGINLSTAILYFSYRPTIKVFLHGSNSYYTVTMIGISLIAALSFVILLLESRRSEGSSA